MSARLIGYAGLTHLGLCSAVGAATKGHNVVGYSEDRELVARIEAGRLPVVEPGLDAAFAANRARLSFSSDPRMLADCEVVYVALDVPTDDAGGSDLASINASLSGIVPAIGPQATLVILSQVPPGFTRQVAFDADRLYYQVETLVFGRALERATLPERFIVGCADPAAPLPPAYRRFLESFGCPILPMRYESAELAKIAINCFLVASVSTTNTLAELCERISADWSEIAPALRLDARIGPSAYITPGLGIAGGNLERDLATVMRLGDREGTATGVIAAYVENSRHMKDWAYQVLKRVVLDTVKRPRLGVLGLAYKQDTHSTRNSAAIGLIGRLRDVEIRVHDPVVPGTAAPGATAVDAAEAVADGADAVVLMTPWAAYRALDPAALAKRMRGRVVIDPYRLLDAEKVAASGLALYSIGRPPILPGRD
ncbi:MAG: UDP-glucose/GDP-mannose dehydrogenase family protein [Alphaproteobacteria bacterium]|nr:UDP-glucose/GDP-mannose dehydrogenase family protein [Alphaproteobacteria bacterium]MCW5738698.1 UDP-glucose/GDP-mannose dehydrogenase family protein [Alphaproteobacteria bacterium]